MPDHDIVNFTDLAECQHEEGLAKIFAIVESTGLSEQVNRDAIVEHIYLWGLLDALEKLNDKHLLTGVLGQKNFNAIIGHDDPGSVACVLIVLNDTGMLDEANRDAIARHSYAWEVMLALRVLHQANLLAGELGLVRFNALMTHSTIFFEGIGGWLWSRVWNNVLTAALFQQMIDIAEQHRITPAEGRIALTAFVRQQIGIVPVRQPNEDLSQSTHTASIEQTVSESVTKLMRRYGMLILSPDLLLAQLEQLSTWVNDLPVVSSDDPSEDLSQNLVTTPNNVAQRCLTRIKEMEYTDPGSNVTLKQLLALTWLAIHDDTKRLGTETDAELLLIEGLYEIQRGDNLSETGIDNQEPEDKFICPPGTFNKLVEKLSGIHPDVLLVYVTEKMAAAKFPIVVREEVVNHLISLSANDLDALIGRILGEAGIELIWAEISDKVAEQILDMYGLAYPGGRANTHFIALMATRGDVSLENLRADVEAACRPAPLVNIHAFYQPTPIRDDTDEITPSNTDSNETASQPLQ